MTPTLYLSLWWPQNIFLIELNGWFSCGMLIIVIVRHIRPSCLQQMSHLRRGHPHISPLATSISGITQCQLMVEFMLELKWRRYIHASPMIIWLFNWTIHIKDIHRFHRQMMTIFNWFNSDSIAWSKKKKKNEKMILLKKIQFKTLYLWPSSWITIAVCLDARWPSAVRQHCIIVQ